MPHPHLRDTLSGVAGAKPQAARGTDDGGDLVVATEAGLYCPAGDFYIDPWAPVGKAVVTHAHSDHASYGSEAYLTSEAGRQPLRTRLGDESQVDGLPYSESLRIKDVVISFYPAGHILGSSQVRIEHRGEVWVVSGDYKTAADPTCAPFEPVACHTFITESTFGLPIYRWRPQEAVFAEINQWWRANAAAGRTSLVFAYSLGKAQRLLAGVDSSIGPIFCHGAVERWNAVYRAAGVRLPETSVPRAKEGRELWKTALVVAPPSARANPWERKFTSRVTAFASGWMQIRGARRRRAVDRGFVLSDHADWPGLVAAIRATGAERVLATHGATGPMVRWLNEQGIMAASIRTRFEGEQDEGSGEEEEGSGFGVQVEGSGVGVQGSGNAAGWQALEGRGEDSGLSHDADAARSEGSTTPFEDSGRATPGTQLELFDEGDV
jgi:putative mRNA 3-end processing factor